MSAVCLLNKMDRTKNSTSGRGTSQFSGRTSIGKHEKTIGRGRGRGRGAHLYRRMEKEGSADGTICKNSSKGSTKSSKNRHEDKYKLVNNDSGGNVTTDYDQTENTPLSPTRAELFEVGTSNPFYDVGALFNPEVLDLLSSHSRIAQEGTASEESDGNQGTKTKDTFREMFVGTFKEDEVLSMISKTESDPEVVTKEQANEEQRQCAKKKVVIAESELNGSRTFPETEKSINDRNSDLGQRYQNNSGNNIALGDSGIDLQRTESATSEEDKGSRSTEKEEIESTQEKDDDSSSSSHSHYRNTFARYNDGYRSKEEDFSDSSTDDGRWSDASCSDEHSSCSQSSHSDSEEEDRPSDSEDDSRGAQMGRRRRRRTVKSGSDEESEKSDQSDDDDDDSHRSERKESSERNEHGSSRSSTETEDEELEKPKPRTEGRRDSGYVPEPCLPKAASPPPYKAENNPRVKTIFNWKTNKMEKARNANKGDRRRTSLNRGRDQSTPEPRPFLLPTPHDSFPSANDSNQPSLIKSTSPKATPDPPRKASRPQDDSPKALYTPTVHDPKPLMSPEPLFPLKANKEPSKSSFSCPRPLFSSPKPLFAASSKNSVSPSQKKSQPIKTPRRKTKQNVDYNAEFPSLSNKDFPSLMDVQIVGNPESKLTLTIPTDDTPRNKKTDTPFSFAKAVKTIGQSPSCSAIAEVLEESKEHGAPMNSVSLDDWLNFHVKQEKFNAKQVMEKQKSNDERRAKNAREPAKRTDARIPIAQASIEEMKSVGDKDMETTIDTPLESGDPEVARSTNVTAVEEPEPKKEVCRRNSADENIRYLLEGDFDDGENVVDASRNDTEISVAGSEIKVNEDNEVVKNQEMENSDTKAIKENESAKQFGGKEYRFRVAGDVLMMEAISMEKDTTYVTDKVSNSYGIFRSHWSPLEEDIWFWKDVSALLDLDQDVQILNVENVPASLAKEYTCFNHDCYYDSGRRLIF